jgi:hypothetical protein
MARLSGDNNAVECISGDTELLGMALIQAAIANQCDVELIKFRI